MAVGLQSSPPQEAPLSNRTLGIVATIIGSAVGAWWYRTRLMRPSSPRTGARDRGTVIFDNTPTAPSAEGVI